MRTLRGKGLFGIWGLEQTGPVKLLVLFFTSFLTIPFARQRFFHAALLARLQVEGVTLDFLNDVFLLHLSFEAAQRVFKRLAFLYANLCQGPTPPDDPCWAFIRIP